MSLDNKVVLVTGGTGSFGQKFVETIFRKSNPKVVRILSRGEVLQEEMRKRFNDHERLRFFIGDVRDRERVSRAMNDVDVVIHAAALKQVPACEYNPIEAVRTNVMGAINIIDAALDRGVDRVIGLSTDKAVNPINLYGATKLCAEKLFVQANSYSAGTTQFSCTRYGNVMGSRGSVIELFVKQGKNGHITITDPRMTRFWISVEDGVDFVLTCIDRMKGGEIFVPKIPSMKIIELARILAPEASIDYIGIRAGEKLHETLISEDESRHTVELDDMFVILPAHPWWSQDNWRQGGKLADGFQYRSDTNGATLDARRISELVKHLDPET